MPCRTKPRCSTALRTTEDGPRPAPCPPPTLDHAYGAEICNRTPRLGLFEHGGLCLQPRPDVALRPDSAAILRAPIFMKWTCSEQKRDALSASPEPFARAPRSG